MINFDIEEYPPQLAIVDSHTGQLSDGDQIPLPYIEAGETMTIANWSVTVDEFIPMATAENEDYVFSEETGAPPFTKVRAFNQSTGESREEWITCIKTGSTC